MGVGVTWPHSHSANKELRFVPRSLCSKGQLTPTTPRATSLLVGFRESMLVTYTWRAEKIAMEESAVRT